MLSWDFPGGSGVKSPRASAGDADSIPGSESSAGGGNGNPLQCSFLENPMDRGDWWAVVHGVAELDRTKFVRKCFPEWKSKGVEVYRVPGIKYNLYIQ